MIRIPHLKNSFLFNIHRICDWSSIFSWASFSWRESAIPKEEQDEAGSMQPSKQKEDLAGTAQGETGGEEAEEGSPSQKGRRRAWTMSAQPWWWKFIFRSFQRQPIHELIKEDQERGCRLPKKQKKQRGRAVEKKRGNETWLFISP